MKKKRKITVNFLNKSKRDVLIEADKADLLWLSKFIEDIAKGKKNACDNGISPYSRGYELFTSYSDLGLTIHRIPCREGKAPLKGYSDKAIRKKYYDSLPTTFSSIYSRIIKLWPEEIPLKAKKSFGETPTTQGKSYWFPAIADNWNQAEDVVDDVFDPYGCLAVFAMYQAFHEEANKLWASGKKTLHTRRVPKKAIEEILWSNLQVGSYWRERKRYIRK